ncbi:unnamed protein product [Heligmosomoides polygyrus]|uniref:Uncharacterized protein n=1 Tax=Heligmosomoides polygyrus TaxID=6339 RepID=A0A183FDN2_HELPZ|nr:unnamed protein product [Heligmosomoides polygyrus]
MRLEWAPGAHVDLPQPQGPQLVDNRLSQYKSVKLPDTEPSRNKLSDWGSMERTVEEQSQESVMTTQTDRAATEKSLVTNLSKNYAIRRQNRKSMSLGIYQASQRHGHRHGNTITKGSGIIIRTGDNLNRHNITAAAGTEKSRGGEVAITADNGNSIIVTSKLINSKIGYRETGLPITAATLRFNRGVEWRLVKQRSGVRKRRKVCKAIRVMHDLMDTPFRVEDEFEVLNEMNFLHVLNPRAVAYAYAFFRHRCAHVAPMSSAVPANSNLRHSNIVGWPYDVPRIIECASFVSGIVVVVPETLHRLRWAKGHTRTQFFYYCAFKDLHLNQTDIFSDVVETVVFVLPDKEPKDAYCWISFMHAVDLWLIRGTRIVLVNGPLSADWNAWDRLNENARESIAAFLDMKPHLLPQVVSLLQKGQERWEPIWPVFW